MRVEEADSRVFFANAVTAETDSLYGAALRLTRDAGQAEELVAETVARAWAALGALEDRTRFRPWLFRILTNLFIGDYRKRSRAPDLEEWTEGGGGEDEDFSLFEKLHQPFLLWWGNPEQEFVNKLLREDIARAIDELPEAFRLVVMLVDVEGFSYRDAAEALGAPVGTIRSRLKRARARLQKSLWRHAAEVGASSGADNGARQEAPGQ